MHCRPGRWSQDCWGGLGGSGEAICPLGHGLPFSSLPPSVVLAFLGREWALGGHNRSLARTSLGLEGGEAESGLPIGPASAAGTFSAETQRHERWAGKSGVPRVASRWPIKLEVGFLPAHVGLCPLGTWGGRLLGRRPGGVGGAWLCRGPCPQAEVAQGHLFASCFVS